MKRTFLSSRMGDIFRQLSTSATEQRTNDRRELGRDRSRSLFLLAGAAIAVLLLFSVFSSSNTARNPQLGGGPGTPTWTLSDSGPARTGQTDRSRLTEMRGKHHRPRAARAFTPKKWAERRDRLSSFIQHSKCLRPPLGPRNAGPTPWGKWTFQICTERASSRVAGSSAHSASG